MPKSPGKPEKSENIARILRVKVPVIAFIGEKRLKLGEVLDLGITHDAGPLLFYQGDYVRITSEP